MHVEAISLRNVARRKKKEERTRTRVKLGWRVPIYQVTQPLTYIFELLTVVQIKGLLQILFMYAQCQHPQPLFTRRGHRVHFLMFGKDKCIDSATLVIWSCLRFDLLPLIRRSDEEVTVDFFWCLTKINTLAVLLLSFHIVCDLTFFDLWPLNHRSGEEVTVDIFWCLTPTNFGTVSFSI